MMGQRKKINLIVEGSCAGCPYITCEDHEYLLESVYVCEHPDSVVSHVSNFNDPWPPIPDNCPLEDVDE